MTSEKRLIDANKLLEELGEEPLVWSGLEEEIQARNDWRMFKNLVESQPTVDAVEVVHGRWEEDKPPKHYIFTGVNVIYRCSECNNRFVHDTHYCPNCGAKMDGDGNGC